MTTNCADGVYNIKYTDKSKNPITVNKKTLIQDILDITLLGKNRLEYGQDFDQNILHMLENFSCPENPAIPGTPDPNSVYAKLLSHPTEGQFWHNDTTKVLYFYDGSNWIPLGSSSDVAGNSGIIQSGQQLPKPVSVETGHVFDYSECSWVVSPFNFPGEIDYMSCYTDSTSLVTSEYRLSSDSSVTQGYAFYQIIGIRYNNNEGTNDPPVPPPPSPTPMVPTPGVSLTPAPTVGVTRTPNPTPTRAPSSTPDPTPGASISPTPTRTPPASVPVSPPPTPTPSVTPSRKPLTALLYVSPSKGYPDNGATEFVSCTTSINTDQDCMKRIAVVVQNITGGVAPYTVNLGGVTYNGSITAVPPSMPINTGFDYSYSGGNGISTNAIRTGCTSTSSLIVYGKLKATNGNRVGCSEGQWTIGINSNSSVLITDSVGNTLRLYTPAGSNGNVYGTAYTSNQGSYSDSYFSGSDCEGCLTCTVQCKNHGGVQSVGVGCMCADGTYLDCT